MEIQEILNLKIDHDDFPEDTTIRGYLRDLLTAVWREGEGFSGKRPFGNSGWEYDLYAPLVKARIIWGELDEEGDIEDLDTKEGDALVLKLIEACFNVRS